jgi:translation initiation factor IF-3
MVVACRLNTAFRLNTTWAKSAPYLSRAFSSSDKIVNKAILDLFGVGAELLVVAHNSPPVVMAASAALSHALSLKSDLVLVDKTQSPPICRIMNFVQLAERKQETRHSITAKKVKELNFKPSIDPHDFSIKIAQARKFLLAGHQVQVDVLLKRNMMPEQGAALHESVEEELKGYFSSVRKT